MQSRPGEGEKKAKSPKRGLAIVGQMEQPAKIAALRDFLITGATQREVMLWVREQGWKDDDKNIREMVAAAKTELASWMDSTNRRVQFGLAVERLSEIYRAAMTAKDRRMAFAAQCELNKLFGLHSPTRVAVGRDNDDLRGLTNEQLRQKMLEAAGAKALPEGA